MSYFLTDDDATFASAFKELRLKAGVDTLRQFCGLLADAGFVIEESTLSRWQGGSRKPRNRQLVVTLIRIFIAQGAISTTEEANRLMHLATVFPLARQEEKELHLSSAQLPKMPITFSSAHSYDLSGVWRSTQTYTTVKQPSKVLTFSIDMKFYRTGNQLVAQSVPNKDNEYIVARFSINGHVLTGTWEHENPDTSEHHASTNYGGAVQLVVSEDGKTIEGQYVGVNREMKVLANKWVFTKK